MPLSPEPLSHLPPDPTPLGCHRAPDLSSLHDTANSTDYLILHMVKVKVAQLCPILCDHMDCAVHGILQARILEWVALPFSRGSCQPRSPALQADSLPAEPQGKPKNTAVGSLSLLQRIFPTQESNQGLLHCRQILY